MRMLVLAALLCAATVQAVVLSKDQHKPSVRYVGQIRYDLGPLINWLNMEAEIQRRTLRPQNLQRWGILRPLGSSITTNGWYLVKMTRDNRKRDWVAIRNHPTDRKAASLVFNMHTTVALPIGDTFMTVPAYDFGTEKPK